MPPLIIFLEPSLLAAAAEGIQNLEPDLGVIVYPEVFATLELLLQLLLPVRLKVLIARPHIVIV